MEVWTMPDDYGSADGTATIELYVVEKRRKSGTKRYRAYCEACVFRTRYMRLFKHTAAVIMRHALKSHPGQAVKIVPAFEVKTHGNEKLGRSTYEGGMQNGNDGS